MKLRFLGPLALLLLACGGGAPEVEEAVVDATPPTVASADRPRKPRPTTQPDGGVDVSSTFPNGLDWVREPPPERTPKSASEARPSAGNEGRPLALKLAEAVLATHTKLVADGPTVVMRVGESSQIELAITLQPGHCYGAYAAGGDGVFELDVVFGIDPGTGSGPLAAMSAMVLAKDPEMGAIATVGFEGGCFKSSLPMPIPAIVRAKATTGGGLVAVQLFQDRAAGGSP